MVEGALLLCTIGQICNRTRVSLLWQQCGMKNNSECLCSLYVQLLLLCCASEDVGPVDCTVDLVVEFIKSQLTTDDGSTRRLRGPYLAQLELMSLLRDRQDNRWNTAFGAFFRSGNTPDEDACLFVRHVLVLEMQCFDTIRRWMEMPSTTSTVMAIFHCSVLFLHQFWNVTFGIR